MYSMRKRPGQDCEYKDSCHMRHQHYHHLDQSGQHWEPSRSYPCHFLCLKNTTEFQLNIRKILFRIIKPKGYTHAKLTITINVIVALITIAITVSVLLVIVFN